MENLPATQEQGGAMTAAPVLQHSLQLVAQPEKVIEQARKACAALVDIISKKPKKVIIRNKQYLEFEDWQLLGSFYGVTVKVDTTREVEIGGARGFEAAASVIHMSTGNVVSAAQAMCLNDEPDWDKRAKYEWIKGVKTKVSEDKVPMFQLRSMAQTRACAKAFRNALAWIAVLGGLAPTPAEEMTGGLGAEQGQAKAAPKAAPATPPPAAPAQEQAPEQPQQQQTPTGGTGGRKISEKQRKRLYAIYKTAGWEDEQVKEYLGGMGIESTTDIEMGDDYKIICAYIEAHNPDGSPK